MSPDRSEQAELPQFPAHRFRHVLGARRHPLEVAWRILARKITPALKSPPGPGLDENEFWLKHQMALWDSGFVDEWTHIDQPLPA